MSLGMPSARLLSPFLFLACWHAQFLVDRYATMKRGGKADHKLVEEVGWGSRTGVTAQELDLHCCGSGAAGAHGLNVPGASDCCDSVVPVFVMTVQVHALSAGLKAYITRYTQVHSDWATQGARITCGRPGLKA
jgi:hypothetical protein